MRIPAAFASLAALALLLAGGPARAETTACTVLPPPGVHHIEEPGHYCLEADFVLGAAATAATPIVIFAKDVVLDCNHHRLVAPANSTGTGIHVAEAASRVVVRNCRIEGFYYGIAADDAPSAYDSRAVRLVGNAIRRSGRYGIFVMGSGFHVEDNLITEGRRLNTGYPTGIYFSGPATLASNNVIRGNTVGDFAPATPTDGSLNLTMGILADYQKAVVIEDNTIHGLRARTGGGVYGIITGHARDMVIRGNRVLSATTAAAPFDGGNYVGIFVQGTPEEVASSICVDNLVGHFNSNFGGCNAAANVSF